MKRTLPRLLLALLFTPLVATLSAGCEGEGEALQGPQLAQGDVRSLPSGFERPTPQFGKGDRAGRTALQGEAPKGETQQGRSADFLAWPVSLEAGEPLEAHLWTSDWSAVYLYNRRQGDDWRETLLEATSVSQKVGLEAQSIRFEAEETGEYLVILGSVNGAPVDYLLHLR